ncbi:Aminodeoxychorismate synthase component 1 [Candidatus Providencia siddallii]|uniref:aminodeoxychorismate synthase n=1 Tax=Candidatus Providencia siddallii TaxID=1715285 RepID=A0A0M6W9Y2_9GAMM|nr:Aminodeoxychorismate synthase component 1 [Candidatus Providencia siddallii]
MITNKIELPYHPDIAIKYFTRIYNQPWAMLLHSGKSNYTLHKYDIIVAEPIATLLTYQTGTIISDLKKTKVFSKKNPFTLLNNFIKKYNFNYIIDHRIPFNGGALGIWSYDLIRHIENIPKISKIDMSFPDMAIGIYLWALTVDHNNKIVILTSYDDANDRLKWLHTQKIPHKNKFKLNTTWKSNMSKKQYKQKINKIHEYLLNGDCYQINLAQRFKAEYCGDEWNVFLKLVKINIAPFSSYICIPENTIISFSPERFILLQNNKIQTQPIKGTLPRLKNIQKDINQIKKLSKSIKNRTENLMIVDLLRNDIGRTAIPGTIKIPELFKVETFPAVHHLVSTITANLSNKYNAINLLESCFPGGSITGVPKIRAIEIIEELEPHRRHGYCGAIGYIDFNGNMDTNIAIRTLITYKKQIFCWSGGGIIADSIANKEYQETLNKIRLILPLLYKNKNN